ncbi:Lipoma HMGIC fusion partner-like 3 protein [Liparis tanakae]|uniref:Lipoma HMGIC fusion partner-like 3 protein n=1 Tax=Liparis tanakae TaxID=230148 RepID=A0A4Z2FFS9_9TELE|nr:Lipoma HMGIC fusion partner-like 3 protein [Liparis tanakae]
MRALCGDSVGSFSPGNCSVHWAYILALLGILDAAILATLAFVLASRQDALVPLGAEPGLLMSAYLHPIIVILRGEGMKTSLRKRPSSSSSPEAAAAAGSCRSRCPRQKTRGHSLIRKSLESRCGPPEEWTISSWRVRQEQL